MEDLQYKPALIPARTKANNNTVGALQFLSASFRSEAVKESRMDFAFAFFWFAQIVLVFLAAYALLRPEQHKGIDSLNAESPNTSWS